MEDHQKKPLGLSERVLSTVNPLSALQLSITDHSEEHVKGVFISIAHQISQGVQVLIEDSFELGHNLDAIYEILRRIKELTVEELGDISYDDLLSTIWTFLIHNGEFFEQKSHTALLTDMNGFYKNSSSVLEETVAALNRIGAELSEFRDDYETPALILKDQPLEVTVALLRKSGQRLEAGKRKLNFIEEGAGRPGRNDYW